MLVPIAVALILAQAGPTPPVPRERTPAGQTFAIRVDAGAQTKPASLTDTFDVPLYTESERVTTAYPDRGGTFMSIAARDRLWKGLTIGAGVSTFARSGDADVVARVPHPFFDQQFRTVEGTARVRREEIATHVAAGWLLPLAGRVQLDVSAGPAFVHTHQAFVTGVQITETYPYDTAAFKSADVTDASRVATGAYAAVDVRWMFSSHVGAGGLVQFTHARVREKVGDRTISIDAGGVQGGGGLRLLF
jgi:hypothetical protein